MKTLSRYERTDHRGGRRDSSTYKSTYLPILAILTISMAISSCRPVAPPPSRLPEPPRIDIIMPTATIFPTYRFDFHSLRDFTDTRRFTMALIQPEIQTLSQAQEYQQLLKDFANAFHLDLQELLTSMNYTLVGPFKERDQMTYVQREQSDFALIAAVSMEYKEEKERETTPELRTITATVQQLHPGTGSGRQLFETRITLTLYETLSWEKLWVKSIPLERISYDYSYRWNREGARVVVGDDTRPHNAVRGFQSIYQTLFETMRSHLYPRELEVLRDKGAEIRSKKKF